MSTPPTTCPPLRIGSLFSGYGGLDLAAEYVFDAETIWYSENNPGVADVFGHHWPDATNLGDITKIDWTTVPHIDVLCGGFPCQDVSTVGRQAGLKPGTRSGLWAHMAEAIDALQPQLVIIENVRGLLSATATPPPERHNTDERNPRPATPANPSTVRELEPDPWGMGIHATRSVRAAGRVLADLADLGMDAQWIGLPASAIGAPHHRYRIFITAWPHTLPHPASLRCGPRRRNPDHSPGTSRHDRPVPPSDRPGQQRTNFLHRQQQRATGVSVAPDRDHLQRWGRYAHAVATWERITQTPAPKPTITNQADELRPSPVFVEWLMGLPTGWITNPQHGLTPNQQLTALGNGVLPLHAVSALSRRRELGW